MTLNVSLTPHLEEFIHQTVSSGRFQSASELVRTALRLLEAAGQAVLNKMVSLHSVYRQGFQIYWALGFTLSDADGLVMASDGGQYVNALSAADTPSLVVRNGAPICRENDADGCVRVFRELTFQGTTEANVLQISSRALRRLRAELEEIDDCAEVSDTA